MNNGLRPVKVLIDNPNGKDYYAIRYKAYKYKKNFIKKRNERVVKYLNYRRNKKTGDNNLIKTKNNKFDVKQIKNVNDFINYIENNIDKYYRKEDKEVVTNLINEFGTDGKPIVVSEKEYGSLKYSEYYKTYRGISNDENNTAKEYVKKFLDGKTEFGTGAAVYGVGNYFTDDKEGADAYSIGRDYSKGEIIEAAIPKKCKAIMFEDLCNEYYEFFEEFNLNEEKYYNKYSEKTIEVLDKIMQSRNISVVGILKQYDVIIKQSEYDNKNIFCVLNRKVLKVKR